MELIRMVLQVIFSVPEVISAEPEVLGRVDALTISGLTGTVSTPNDDHLQSARDYWEMVEWEWADPSFLEPPSNVSSSIPSEAQIDWGWISTKPEYGVNISKLLLSLDSEETYFEADIYGWFRAVTDWLQAYTLQVLAPQSSGDELSGRPIRAWRVANDEAEDATNRYRRSDINIPEWRLVTSQIWKACVRLASAGDDLPLNWQLLGDGLRALYAGHPRRAVIEAFTALEVTIREAIHVRVEQCGDPVVTGAIMNQRSTLWPLINMAKDLGIGLPESLNRPLVDLRNSAVHSGRLPSHSDALRVWQAAHMVSQQYSPLPAP
jgi:hypothetical protein